MDSTWNYITDPKTKKKYSIKSPEGQQLLEIYFSNSAQRGGASIVDAFVSALAGGIIATQEAFTALMDQSSFMYWKKSFPDDAKRIATMIERRKLFKTIRGKPIKIKFKLMEWGATYTPPTSSPQLNGNFIAGSQRLLPPDDKNDDIGKTLLSLQTPSQNSKPDGTRNCRSTTNGMPNSPVSTLDELIIVDNGTEIGHLGTLTFNKLPNLHPLATLLHNLRIGPPPPPKTPDYRLKYEITVADAGDRLFKEYQSLWQTDYPALSESIGEVEKRGPIEFEARVKDFTHVEKSRGLLSGPWEWMYDLNDEFINHPKLSKLIFIRQIATGHTLIRGPSIDDARTYLKIGLVLTSQVNGDRTEAQEKLKAVVSKLSTWNSPDSITTRDAATTKLTLGDTILELSDARKFFVSNQIYGLLPKCETILEKAVETFLIVQNAGKMNVTAEFPDGITEQERLAIEEKLNKDMDDGKMPAPTIQPPLEGPSTAREEQGPTIQTEDGGVDVATVAPEISELQKKLDLKTEVEDEPEQPGAMELVASELTRPTDEAEQSDAGVAPMPVTETDEGIISGVASAVGAVAEGFLSVFRGGGLTSDLDIPEQAVLDAMRSLGAALTDSEDGESMFPTGDMDHLPIYLREIKHNRSNDEEGTAGLRRELPQKYQILWNNNAHHEDLSSIIVNLQGLFDPVIKMMKDDGKVRSRYEIYKIITAAAEKGGDQSDPTKFLEYYRENLNEMKTSFKTLTEFNFMIIRNTGILSKIDELLAILDGWMILNINKGTTATITVPAAIIQSSGITNARYLRYICHGCSSENTITINGTEDPNLQKQMTNAASKLIIVKDIMMFQKENPEGTVEQWVNINGPVTDDNWEEAKRRNEEERQISSEKSEGVEIRNLVFPIHLIGSKSYSNMCCGDYQIHDPNEHSLEIQVSGGNSLLSDDIVFEYWWTSNSLPQLPPGFTE